MNVVLEGLVRRFQDDISIGPIQLEVKDGELVTLLGPSGSGKTTTLKMIAGFIELDSGRVLFDGVDVANVPPRERGIGMVHQSAALFPNMNVYQNIAFGPEMAGWSYERTVERVEDLAELLDIGQLLMRRIDEISGGEKQRVALARALAKEPKLLLLDEPLSALDPQLREKLQMEIRRIQRKVGITTLYVTHSQDEAFAISDRVAILQDGVIVQTGTPESLYDAPKTEFVARFLGSGNVFLGTVKSSHRGYSLVNVHGREFRLKGVYEPGDELRFGVKPEDVTVSIGSAKNPINAKLLGITPQVGSYRITLSTNDSRVVSVTHNESLIKELRNALNGQVSFTFRPEDAVVFDR